MNQSIFQTWSAREIACACGGRVNGDDELRPTGIGNDSRRLGTGDLFVALKAERDGHDFIDHARAAGARLFLVNGERAPAPGPDEAVIAVADTFDGLEALGRALWEAHRTVQPGRLTIGITGSNGKTTTCRLVGRLLEAAYPGRVLVTRGNLNNHIGLPMMLAELGRQHTHVALEMGASQPGDIAQLIAIAPVDRAVVTSIAAAHLEGFGSETSVIAEKGQVFCGQPAAKIAILPHAERNRGLLSADYPGEVRTVGENDAADVQVSDYRDGSPAHVELRLPEALGGDTLPLTVQLPGRHNAMNVASAVAVVWDTLPANGRRQLVQSVVGCLEAVKGRLRWRTGGGPRVLDDSYNANPGSVEAALTVLAQQDGPRAAVLGDMLELGRAAAEAHRDIGRQAGDAGCEAVFAVGEFAERVAEGARQAGVSQVLTFRDAHSCARAISSVLGAESVVLVKGSRGVGLEIVADMLVGEETANAI